MGRALRGLSRNGPLAQNAIRFVGIATLTVFAGFASFPVTR